jgi:hypothetical protein
VPYGSPLPPPGSPYPVEDPGSTLAERLRYAAICIAVAFLASVPAAWLWIKLADPPSARLTGSGLQFGETSFDQVSTITLWFAVVGFGFALVLGFVAAVLGRRHGVVAVLTILVASWVGVSMTLWFGVHVFGPDHPIDFVALFNGSTAQRSAMLKGFDNGDVLVSTVQLASPVGLLGWPVGAMLGALAGVTMWPHTVKAGEETAAMPPATPPS